ncbi:hypothetical protein Tco_0870785 [Tanacetum coccineum]
MGTLIEGESLGEAEPTIPHTVPETLTEPAHSHDQASSSPRPTTIPASAQENEQGPFSDPNPAYSSRPDASEPKQFTSTNVEDDVFGGSFDISPPRSTEAPPAGTTSGGAEDPDKLTALCSLVNSLVQKIDSQASDLKAHKLVFKEVVGKLVKKVKELEDKLKGRKRKFVMTESDIEEEEEQDVDPLIKLAKAAATAAADSAVPTSGSNADDIPPSSSTPSDAFAGGSSVLLMLLLTRESPLCQVHANQVLSADLLGPDVNEDIFVARMVALIAERRRQFAAQRFQDKRNKPMIYAQQRDYMRTFVKNQSSTIYTTGWTMKHVRSFSDDQLKDEFDKVRHALANLQSQHLRRSLKRQGADLEQPNSKKSKSTEPQKTSVPAASRPSSAGVTPDVHQSPFVDTPPTTPPHSPKALSHPNVTPDTSKQPSVAPTPPSGFLAIPTVTRTSVPRTRSQSSAAGIKTYSTRRKSLRSRKMSSSEVDLNAADKSFIKVLSDDDSDASDGDTNPLYWHAFAAWEIVPTGLGDVNALYFADKSSKYFTHLREILHLLDRQDLSKLYGMVVKHYEANPIAGAGMMLWGDLYVLFESVEGGSSVEVWADQKDWVVSSWRLFPFSGVHVLETFSGTVLYMFADTPYPLSASTMKKMLKHKLEVEINGIGNDMTHAEQLIAFIKNRLAACLSSA